MAKTKEINATKKKHLQIAVVVLLILVLVTSAVALVLHFREKNVSGSGEDVKITQNIIGSTKSQENGTDAEAELSNSKQNDGEKTTITANTNSPTTEKIPDIYIELGKNKPTENLPFEMNEMLPGDSETKSFNLVVHNNKPVTVNFSAAKTLEEKNYADAMKIEISSSEQGAVLFSGTFSDFIKNGVHLSIPKNKDNSTNLNYIITVSLDFETENKYQYGKLAVDFKWDVEEKDKEALEKIPGTGDKTAMIVLIGVALVALSLAVVLSRSKKKECDE